MNLDEARPIVIRYCNETENYLNKWKVFCHQNGIRKDQYFKIAFAYDYNKKKTDKGIREVMATTLGGEKPRLVRRRPTKLDKREIDDGEKLALARKVYEDAMIEGAPTAKLELAVRMLGLLIDRQERVNIELSADDIARRNLEADRQLREFDGRTEGHRVEEVQEESSILPD